MKKILFLLICVVVAREEWWELLRCDYEKETCYLHHQKLPTDDRWLMECFYSPVTPKGIKAPPELKRFGSGK